MGPSERKPPDKNVSARLPNSDVDAELLKPAIAELLPTIPTTWADRDLDTLTDAQQPALFLLVAAGMVEQPIRFRQRMLNHPFVVEATITATDEHGYVEAMQPLVAKLWDRWADAWRQFVASEVRRHSAFPV